MPVASVLANRLERKALPTATSSEEPEQPLSRQDGPFSTISMEMADTLSLQVVTVSARWFFLYPQYGDTLSLQVITVYTEWFLLDHQYGDTLSLQVITVYTEWFPLYYQYGDTLSLQVITVYTS